MGFAPYIYSKLRHYIVTFSFALATYRVGYPSWVRRRRMRLNGWRQVGTALVAGALACGSARAEDTSIFLSRTTQALYQNCKSDNTLRTMACVSYLRGVFDALNMTAQASYDAHLPKDVQAWLRASGMCNPEVVTIPQLRQVFIAWAEKNPTKWQDDQYLSAWRALTDAWPCPASERP